MKASKLILIISFLLSLAYLLYIRINFGQLETISKSADYLTFSGNEYLFFIFVWQLGLTFAWITKSIPGAIAAGLLPIIGTITGYNPDIVNNQLEKFLHIFCAASSIVIIFIDMIRKNNLAGVITTVLFFISGLTIALTEKEYYIYWIEVSALLTVYSYYYKYVSGRNKKYQVNRK